MRVKGFLKEPILFVRLRVFIVNIPDFLSKLTGPVTKNLLGLPSGEVAALLVGFLRKDVVAFLLG